MAISLTSALRSRQPLLDEDCLETGTVYMYTGGTSSANIWCGMCWKSPGTGTAIIEAWGAGGPGARMCCCGFGTAGNSGAYVKKTIAVDSSSYITGCAGNPPCSSSLCFQGCGDPSMLCWRGAAGTGCICAEGGKGGLSICSTGNSLYCCFIANGYCYDAVLPYLEPNAYCCTSYCGTICNVCSGMWIGCAYGGDVNINSLYSKVEARQCQAICYCYYYYSIPTPAGMFSEKGNYITFVGDTDGGGGSPGQWSGHQFGAFSGGMNALSRSPKRGQQNKAHCWRADKLCGCYEMTGCSPLVGIGIGGLAPQPCPDVRDQAYRGGWGAIRIKFIG